MNVLIRTDIGSHHGMGHAVRMLALARELQRRGASVTFVTATEALRNYVVPFRCDVGVGLQAVSTPCQPGDILIVDTKADDWANDASALWLSRDAGMRVVRIDHPYATPESCDLLIGPCAHWSHKTVQYLQRGFGARFLYGFPYVLLSPQVTQLPPRPYADRYSGAIVFVAGGTDPSGALQQLYDLTAAYATDHVCVFLIGTHATMLNPKMPQPRAHTSVIASFDRTWIRNASLVVTMFGVTCYEAMWWETPHLVLCHPTNPYSGDAMLYTLQSNGCSRFLGKINSLTQARVTSCLSTTDWGVPVQRPSVFDGLGVQRVAQAICELAISSTCTQ